MSEWNLGGYTVNVDPTAIAAFVVGLLAAAGGIFGKKFVERVSDFFLDTLLRKEKGRSSAVLRVLKKQPTPLGILNALARKKVPFPANSVLYKGGVYYVVAEEGECVWVLPPCVFRWASPLPVKTVRIGFMRALTDALGAKNSGALASCLQNGLKSGAIRDVSWQQVRTVSNDVVVAAPIVAPVKLERAAVSVMALSQPADFLLEALDPV